MSSKKRTRPAKRFDRLTKAQRSERMSLIRNANTKPELTVREILDTKRVRYSIHGSSLPGKPDIVFTRERKVLFINGCFWHLHSCGTYRLPLTRKDFWLPKLYRNHQNDKKVRRSLNRLGWRYLNVWECQLRDIDKLTARLLRFLEN